MHYHDNSISEWREQFVRESFGFLTYRGQSVTASAIDQFHSISFKEGDERHSSWRCLKFTFFSYDVVTLGLQKRWKEASDLKTVNTILKQQQPTLNHLTRQYIGLFGNNFNRKHIAQPQHIGDDGAHCIEMSC